MGKGKQKTATQAKSAKPPAVKKAATGKASSVSASAKPSTVPVRVSSRTRAAADTAARLVAATTAHVPVGAEPAAAAFIANDALPPAAVAAAAAVVAPPPAPAAAAVVAEVVAEPAVQRRVRRKGTNNGQTHGARVEALSQSYLVDDADNKLSVPERKILAAYIEHNDPGFMARLRADGMEKDDSLYHVGFKGLLNRGAFGKGGEPALSVARLTQATADLKAMEARRKSDQRAKKRGEKKGGVSI